MGEMINLSGLIDNPDGEWDKNIEHALLECIASEQDEFFNTHVNDEGERLFEVNLVVNGKEFPFSKWVNCLANQYRYQVEQKAKEIIQNEYIDTLGCIFADAIEKMENIKNEAV